MACFLMMCTTGKITRVNAMYGANRDTLCTARAKRIVNGGKIVVHLNRTVRAGLFAFHATDTAIGAAFARLRTLVVIRTRYDDFGVIVDQLDDVVGAFSDTDSASDAEGRINYRHTIPNRDGILRAGSYTVAVAVTSIATRLVTAVEQFNRTAGLGTAIVKFFGYDVAVSVAGNVCYFFNHVQCFNTEDFGNHACGGVAAGNAKVSCLCGAIAQRLCIAVTAAVAAGTAIGTGQTFADQRDCLIFLHTEKGTCKRQEDRAKQGNAEEYEDRN